MLRPNLLISVADDLGREHFPGTTWATDPIDLAFLRNLLGTSLHLPQLWTEPNCSATRASWLTGHQPVLHGLGAAVGSGEGYLLPTSAPSFFRDLAEVGYTVRVVGKWHLVPPGSPQAELDPISRGANRWRGSFGNVQDYYAWESIAADTSGSFSRSPETTYHSEKLRQWAIEDLAEMPEPWCLWLAWQAPGGPSHVPPQGTYRTPAVDDRGKFHAAGESMDGMLASVWSSLHPLVQVRTMLLACGDNGSPLGVSGSPPGQGKETSGEYGIGGWAVCKRGWLPSQASDPALTAAIDWRATFWEAARGVGTWNGSVGRSFWPLILGQPFASRERIFADAFRPNSLPDVPKTIRESAARGLRYKLRRLQDQTGAVTELLSDLFGGTAGSDGEYLDMNNLPPTAAEALTVLRNTITTGMIGGDEG